MNWKNFGEPSIQIGNFITNIQSSAGKKRPLISFRTQYFCELTNHNCLTLYGMGHDIFIPLSLLDQILSVDFFQKFPNFFGGENWHQLGYFDTLPRTVSLIKVAPW